MGVVLDMTLTMWLRTCGGRRTDAEAQLQTRAQTGGRQGLWGGPVWRKNLQERVLPGSDFREDASPVGDKLKTS